MSNDSEIKELVEFLVRPIVGIECLSPKEVFDVMSDRIRRALERLASQPTPQPSGDAVEEVARAIAIRDYAYAKDPWDDLDTCDKHTYLGLAQAALAAYRPHEQAAIQKAVEDERERCAKIADGYASLQEPHQHNGGIAAIMWDQALRIRDAIRSGGEG